MSQKRMVELYGVETNMYNLDAEMPHMGLTTWKNAPDGRVQKSDTVVAKNYLSDFDKEIKRLKDKGLFDTDI